MENRVRQLEKRQNESEKEIAILKNIASSIDSKLENINETLAKHYTEYMQMQGTIKLVLDVREQNNETFKDHEERIRRSENFIQNLKGKIAVWAIFGGFIAGILSTLITDKL